MKPDEFRSRWKALFEGAYEEGPTFILETHRRKDAPSVLGQLEQAMGGGYRATPLFGDTPEPMNERVPDLGCFWEVSFPARPFEAWNESPWDMAYDIQDLTEARSIEPDIPSSFHDATPLSLMSGCNAPDSDDPADPDWALNFIKAPGAWHALAMAGYSTGKDILIGQPDTGVAAHDDLVGALDLSRAWNYVEGGASPLDPLRTKSFFRSVGLRSYGHGTATSSVVAGRRNSSVQGSTRDARVVPIRAIKTVIRHTQRNVAKAVEHARRSGCQVVSMSLGGVPLRALKQAIAAAIADNVIVVSAAGNCVGWVVYPARYKSVISIGGSNIGDVPWRGSSHGKRVDVSAPAEFVWRALREKRIEPETLACGGQGTSYATALTAGVGALWLNDRRTSIIASLGPDETIQERFRYCLKRTARTPAAGWNTAQYGAGIVDAERLVTSGCGLAPVPAPAWSVGGPDDYPEQVEGMLEEHGQHDLVTANETLERVRNLSHAERERFGHEIVTLALMDKDHRLIAYGRPRESRRLRATRRG